MHFPVTRRDAAALCGSFAAFLFVFGGRAVGAPDKAPVYPKTDPAHTFADLKIFAADGTPLRVPRDDWEQARKRVVSDPAWAMWANERRREIDDWILKRHDHPEWTAGWLNDFVSPKDGSRLTYTPDEPGEDTLHSPSDPRVSLTPKLRAAWVYCFRDQMAREMVEAAKMYRLTGDKKYADWTAAQLDFYADNFATWPTSPKAIGNPASKPQPGVRLMWQSLDEAVDLCHYVEAARILGNYVTPTQKTKWTQLLFLPDVALLNGTFRFVHNIACWHRAAAGFVAVYTGDAALWKVAVEEPLGIRDQLARGVTSDYLWREQSIGYNAYVAAALTPFFTFAAENGYGPKLISEMETTENMLLAPLYLRFPTGQLPNPCDGGAPRSANNFDTLADDARLFPTTIGVEATRTRHDWDTLIDPPVLSDKGATRPAPALSTLPALPPVATRNFDSIRMAVLRRGHWQAYLHYGQITQAHAQAEALNYEAFYDNTDVTHDPGTASYASPLHGNFFTTGLAHNVPLVDGRGENGIHLGSVQTFDAAAPRISVEIPGYFINGSAQRDLSLSDDELHDSVTVKTTDGATHEIGLLMQIQGVLTLPSTFQPDPDFTVAGPTRPAGFRYWSDVTSAPCTDTAAFDITYPDGRGLHLTIHLAGGFTVTHATTLDSPPKKREVLFIHTTGTGAVFDTRIGPR